MRLLRLMNDEFAVEFHPYVTVVGDLDEGYRRRIVEVIEGLPRGVAADLGGLVESHGVVLDLDADSLGLLDMHNFDVDVVVAVDDLPGNEGSGGPPEASGLESEARSLAEQIGVADAEVLRRREAVGEAQIEVERAAHAIDALEARSEAEVEAVEREWAEEASTREARSAEVAAAAALLADTEATLDAARARLADAESVAVQAREARDGLAVEASALAGRLESASAGLDPDATGDVEAAERHLAAVREAADRERDAEQVGQSTPEEEEPVEHRLARLEVQRTDLDAKLAVLGGAETIAVETAIQGLRTDASEPALVVSADALELADEIELARADIASRGVGLADDEGPMVAARARLDAARQALADAEQRVRVPQLDRDEIDQLEVAHADVLDAQEKSEGRFSKGRAERRLEEARAAEDAVLQRLGFDSYADYMMGTSMLLVDDEQENALDEARAELAAAEDAWAALQEGVDSTVELALMKDKLRVLDEKALLLLGEPPTGDVIDALRAHRVAVARVGDDHGRLVAALQSVGMAVAHEDLETDELVLLAEDWIGVEAEASGLRDSILLERADVDLELAEARSQLSQAAAGMSGPSREDRLRARIDDAVAALDAATERVRRHERTSEEVDELRAAFAAVTQRVEAATVEVTSAEAVLEGAAGAAAEAEATHAAIASAHGEVERTVDACDEPDALGSVEDDSMAERRAEAQLARDVVDAQLVEAREALALAEATAAELREKHQDLEAGLDAARMTPIEASPSVGAASAEEVEWYLLSRLAAQRRISFAGSVPLLIDRALDGLTGDEIQVVLDRLERMAAAVQLIVISDHEAASTWAERAGEQRGAVVRPMKPADVVPFG